MVPTAAEAAVSPASQGCWWRRRRNGAATSSRQCHSSKDDFTGTGVSVATGKPDSDLCVSSGAADCTGASAAGGLPKSAVRTCAASGERTGRTSLDGFSALDQAALELRQSKSSPATSGVEGSSTMTKHTGRYVDGSALLPSSAAYTPVRPCNRPRLAQALSSMAAAHPTQLFADRYILAAEQKHGGQSVVQFARDQADGMKQYAIKCGYSHAIVWSSMFRVVCATRNRIGRPPCTPPCSDDGVNA